jgi:bilirubin oxidase
VAVGPGENVSIIMKFDDFVTAREIDYSTGKFPYMFHCHILEHDDHGMMAQFAIV